MNLSHVEARYSLPKRKSDAVKVLSSILEIPTHKLTGNQEAILIAMAGTIMYRHLNRLDKIAVMKSIESLSNPYLQEDLRGKCVLPTANPKWAAWSLTTSELEDVLKFHDQFNRWSSVLGANPGAYGVSGSVWSIAKQGGVYRKHWGAVSLLGLNGVA